MSEAMGSMDAATASVNLSGLDGAMGMYTTNLNLSH
jgi:hypothetical protein